MVGDYYHYIFTNLVSDFCLRSCCHVKAVEEEGAGAPVERSLRLRQRGLQDLYTLDLEAYKAGGCNVTGLRLVDTDSAQTRALIADLRRLADEKRMLLLPTIGVQV